MSDTAIRPRSTPFHGGEREAQRLAGVHVHGAAIRDRMPDQHRAFFSALPYLLVAVADAGGWPVATMLAGPPGFVSSPDPASLRIARRPDPADPTAAHLTAGVPIGLLGIDLATRRRNRVNGTVRAVCAEGFDVAVAQSFGNCPQYIQARPLDGAWDRTAVPASPAEVLDSLDQEARLLIGAADTFFVASTSGARDAEGPPLDISHRGGRPGFVGVSGDALLIPDFRGNNYFNTFGNFVRDPRAGLLFVDFASGDLLHVEGRASVLWNDWTAAERFGGAERLWRVDIAQARRRRRAVPLRWGEPKFSPFLERTGHWR